MAETYKTGQASITVEQAAYLKVLDKTADGAASSFLRHARAVLDPIVTQAARAYPKRTGEAASSMVVRDNVDIDSIEVTAYNEAKTRTGYPYGYVLRFSIRTKQSLDMEALRKTDQELFDEALEETGSDPVLFARWFAKKNGRRMTAQDRVSFYRRRLTRTHGQGAPDGRAAGKVAWGYLVRTPARKGTKRLIELTRTDLQKLADG